MRRGEKEITEREEIDEIMRRAQVCRIALCDGDRPYIVPVNFGYSGNALYIHSAREGKKLDILRENPNVSFEVDIDHALVAGEITCAYTFNYRSVVGFGRATVLRDIAEKHEGMNAIVRHYVSGEASFPDGALAEVTVVRIEISSITGKRSGY